MSVGALPDFIPPHLAGKVSDFRNEDNGSVSFQHPDAALGLSPELSRVSLSPESYRQTFDPDHRRMNFSESMNGQYAMRSPGSFAGSLNRGIAGALRKAFDWGTSDQGKAVGTVGALSALGGGLGSYLWGKKTGGGSIKRSLLLALLAGGAGAGATALAQRGYNKRTQQPGAALQKAASEAVSLALVRAVENDVNLSYADRSTLLRSLASLPSSDRDSLYRLMRTSIGAGAGVLIARFLGGKGLLPAAVGGILGSMITTPSSSRMRYNALGQPSIRSFL